MLKTLFIFSICIFCSAVTIKYLFAVPIATIPLRDALIHTGKMRMRPILMTTMTTILSMIPPSLGIGEGSEVLQSMGIVIIGGLITSTLLVLLLMPAFYLIIDKKSKVK